MSLKQKSIIVSIVVFIFSSLIVFTSVTPIRKSLMQRLYVRSTSELLFNELSSVKSIINIRIEQIVSRASIFKVHPDLTYSNKLFDTYNSEDLSNILLENDQKWLNNDYDLINSVLNNELSNNIKTDFYANDYYLNEYGYNIFSEVFVTNKYGAVVSSSLKTEDYNQSDEEWWLKAKEQGIYVEGVVLDKNTQTLSITIAVAIKDDNKFLGVTKGTLDIKDIFYSIFNHRNTRLNPYAYSTYLLTDKLDVIFPLDSEYEQQAIDFIKENNSIISNVNESKYLESSCFTNNQETCIYSYTDYLTISDLKIKLLSVQKLSVLDTLLHDSENLTLLIITITIFITLILFILLITFTNRQIFHINSTLKKVSQGKINSKIKIITNDEIGTLAKNINDILEYLTKSKIYEETIIKHIDYPLFIFDKNKKLVFLNIAATNLLQIKSTKKLINNEYSKIINLYHRDDGPFSKNPIDNIYNEKKEFVNLIDLDLMINKNTKIPVDLLASSLYDTKNNFIGIVTILRDTTEYRELDKTKSEFVSIASHQLRTPLTAIKWYSEALAKGLGEAVKPDKTQENYINVIQQSTNRVIDLVNALLNVSRLEMGTFVVEPTNLYLKQVMNEVVTQIKPLITNKKLNLSTKCDPKVPAVMMDKNIIQIVFENIVSNAIKYTPENGNIEISGTYTEDKKILNRLPNYIGNAGILIKVKDNGLGIPAKQQKFIFTKLFRADNVKKIEESGTGLGLYTCKLIMEKIGGAIWFESNENVGSTFYLLLPIEGMIKKEGSKKLENIT